MDKPMITMEQREDLLRENWISHDARWFIKTAVDKGVSDALDLNRKVIRSVGKTEFKRLLAVIGRTRITDIETLIELFQFAGDLYFPKKRMDFGVAARDESWVVFRVTKCHIYDDVSAAGLAGQFKCACDARVAGWYAAAKVKGGIEITAALMEGAPECEIILKPEFGGAE